MNSVTRFEELFLIQECTPVDTLEQLLEKYHQVGYCSIFGKVVGGAIEGIFLSQAYVWSIGSSGNNGRFCKSQEEWYQATVLTIKQQNVSRKTLSKMGILLEKKQGIPCKLYCKIDKHRLTKLIYEFVSNDKNNPRLATPKSYWGEVKKRVHERDRVCQHCGSSQRLHVHHKNYFHRGDELNHMEDLVLLCSKCHGTLHRTSNK
jgi:hypothetical protein